MKRLLCIWLHKASQNKQQPKEVTQLNWVKVRKIMQSLRNISQEIHFNNYHFSKFLCYSMGWPHFNFMELMELTF